MKQLVTGIVVCTLVVPVMVGIHSEGWSACSVDQRIQLGNQGYDKAEVEKACEQNGNDFWDILSRELATGLATGLTNELNQTLGLRENGGPAQAPAPGATVCETNYGTCPLAGGPIGYPCYCPGWNGYMFKGSSR